MMHFQRNICLENTQIIKSPGSLSDIEVFEYNSLEECDNELRDLCSRAVENPFFTYEWLLLWKKYFAQKANTKVLVIKEKGKIIGFLPLIWRRIPILSTIIYKFMGTSKSNYLCIPAVESCKEKVYNEVFNYFEKNEKGSVLLIDGVNDSTSDYTILSEKQNNRKKVSGYKFFQLPCPYINLEGKWDDLFKKHYAKSKRRSKLKSFEDRLEHTGNVEFIRICDKESYDSNAELLEQTFAIHRLRFRNEWNSSKYSEEGYSDFYREMIREYAWLGILDMSLLCIDGIVVSFILALRQGRTLISYVLGYYLPFKCFSLGHVHLMKLFRQILSKKEITCFDFSLGNHEYKTRWADGYTNNYSFLFSFGCNPFTFVIALFIRLLIGLKVVVRKKGWNEKIKHVLVSVKRKKNDGKSCFDEDGFLVEYKEKPVFWTSERENSFKELLTIPLWIQSFVLKQIYFGKKIYFLYHGSNLAGIKTIGEQEVCIYQYVSKKRTGSKKHTDANIIKVVNANETKSINSHGYI